MWDHGVIGGFRIMGLCGVWGYGVIWDHGVMWGCRVMGLFGITGLRGA